MARGVRMWFRSMAAETLKSVGGSVADLVVLACRGCHASATETAEWEEERSEGGEGEKMDGGSGRESVIRVGEAHQRRAIAPPNAALPGEKGLPCVRCLEDTVAISLSYTGQPGRMHMASSDNPERNRVVRHDS